MTDSAITDLTTISSLCIVAKESTMRFTMFCKRRQCSTCPCTKIAEEIPVDIYTTIPFFLGRFFILMKEEKY